ncbi:isochorismate synthase [Ilumatobacter nonamiensis]|uniref:isochorismate synthase n=1 Tax=Ilumatobacter nonamiensis TaxID=467093 RepID=UPI000346B3F1|nr:isochorismate synthase [Ilumatobacter nonamiensis]
MKAITRPLSEFTDAAPDLNDIAADDGVLFVRGGNGVAGSGVATRVAADDAADLLASIEHDSSVGAAAPIAVGGVPFRPGADSDLLIPAVTVVKRDGDAWVTAIDGADIDAALAPPREPEPTAPSWTIAPLVDIDHYLAAVAQARDAVRAGTLTKAVIARPIEVAADGPISIHAVLRRLKATFSSSYRFSIDGFVGASPELLVEVEGAVIRSHPLAGTTPRTGDVDNDARLAAELQASTKNQIEHRVVIDDVHDRLLPYVSYLDWEPEPSVVTVANVQHLGTRMEGMLSQPGPSVVELVRALSPTPALGGHPRSEALDLIGHVEGFERGRYGGAVGWVDAHGDGAWAVAIRCAEFASDRRSARLVAGGGIVADSDPLAELAETQAKFQAMLSAIIRP